MSAPNLIRADLHNHSHYSPDSIASPDAIVRRAVERGLNVIAVTDHNTTRGGHVVQELAAKRGAALRVVVGEEVKTRDGEILGLFLTEDIPRDLPAMETIERIHAQGGVAGAPHPFDPFRSGLHFDVLEEIATSLDFIECLNARMIRSKPNDQAREFATTRNLPMSAASDAHSPREIARAYVEMPPFDTPQQLIESLRAGQLKGRLSSPFIHWISRYAVIRRKLGWRPG